MQTNQQNKLKVFGRATPRRRLTAAVVCVTVVAFFVFFWWAGHNKIDMGRWLGYCGLKQRYRLPCPTCGMTTAALAFAQGRILQAFYIQPAGAFFCSIMAVAAVLALLIAVFGVKMRFLGRFFNEVKVRYIILAVIVIIAAGWAVTLARALVARN